MAISGGDGTIILNTKIDTSGINKGMLSIKNTVGTVGSVLATAFSVRALVNFGKESINLASDLQEVQNVVDVAFGSMKKSMEDFADTAIETFGISKLTAKQTGSSYMAMAKGMQIADEAAAEMALNLTGLSADMASFYNIQQSEARTALSAVFTGETETLKRYGILITEVNLQEYARQQGITKSINAMTQQEKVMLRYQYILQATQLAQGDFVRTQDSWANQTRILAERWKEMQSIFGQAFVAIGTLILPAVNALISKMTELAQITFVAAQNVYKMFTGKTLESESTTLENVGESSGSAAEGVEELGDATEDAKKKIDKSLASFDELNIISSNISEGISEGFSNNIDNQFSNFGGISGGLVENDEGTDYMQKAEEINEALSYIMGLIGLFSAAVGVLLLLGGHPAWGIGFIIAGAATLGVSMASLSGDNVTENAYNALSNLMGILTGVFVAIGVILCWLGSWAWGVGFIIAGATIFGVSVATLSEFDSESIISSLMYIQGTAAGAMLALGVILLYFGGATPMSLGLIASGATLLAISAVQILRGEFEAEIVEMISKIVLYVSTAFLFLGAILLFTPMKGLGIALLITGAMGIATGVMLSSDAVIEEVTGMLMKITMVVITFMLVIGIILLFTPMKATGIGMIAVGAIGLATAIALDPSGVYSQVTTMLQTLTLIIATFAVAIGVILLFTPGFMAAGIGLIAAGALGLFTVSATEFNSSEMQTALENELNEVNNVAQEGVDRINATLASVNMSAINGGGYSGSYGYSGYYNSPGVYYSIPKLANGAVIPPNSEFLAILGDQKNGVNIEAPLSTLKQAFREEMIAGGSNKENININFTGSLSQLARVLKPKIQRETVRADKSLLTGE